MKRVIYGMAAVALEALGACSPDSKTNDSISDGSSKEMMAMQSSCAIASASEASDADGAAMATADNFVGVYTDPDDGSTLEISKGSDGRLDVVISIVRLTLIDDGRGSLPNGTSFRFSK